MSVRGEEIVSKKTGKTRTRWMVDVEFEHASGQTTRVRKVSPVQTKRGAEQYERDIRAALLDGTYGKEEEQKQAAAVPKLADFKDRFMKEYCAANKQKPSGLDAKESSFKHHLLKLFGDRRLDSFTAADEDRLKGHFATHAASTYNNAASTLNMALKAAERWKVIPHVPHRFQLLKRQQPRPKFYDFEQYDWLVDASEKIDLRSHVVTLLGGDAGLRRGEIIALEGPDLDLRRGLITVERSEWRGKVTETKGMEYRVIPMTARLKRALTALRHLRGPRVLYTDDGATVTAKVLRLWMTKVQRKASLKANGEIHILRHTFCSHLAMKGAPALSIQKLAGHKDLKTTLGYMHLAQGETDRAIRLLEQPAPANGNMAATEPALNQQVAI